MANFSYRKWLYRGLRMSVIAGAVGAAWHIWETFSRFSDDRMSWIKTKYTMECAGRAQDAELARHVNEFGNINVKGVFCSDRDFLVSWQELASVRAGTMKFETGYSPFDWEGSIMVFALSGGGVILATVIILAAIATARWIWGWPKNGNFRE